MSSFEGFMRFYQVPFIKKCDEEGASKWDWFISILLPPRRQ